MPITRELAVGLLSAVRQAAKVSPPTTEDDSRWLEFLERQQFKDFLTYTPFHMGDDSRPIVVSMLLSQIPFEWKGRRGIMPEIFARAPGQWYTMRFSLIDTTSGMESEWVLGLMRQAHTLLRPTAAFAGLDEEVVAALLSGAIDRAWPIHMGPDGSLVAIGATPFLSEQGKQGQKGK